MEVASKPLIDPSWFQQLKTEFEADYFKDLKKSLLDEKKLYRIFPPGKEIFAAYNQTPFNKVKVVIIGQDPYHGFGQAHGLCFSVRKGIKIPPSLKNIYQELAHDVNFNIPNNGDLTPWTKEGVFLLNACLTVREKQPASHQQLGWFNFTDATISALSNKRENLVFLLWGKFAHEKGKLVDHQKHLVLKAAHPSPFSVYRGFYGCKHFSKTNEYLEKHQINPINWQL